MTCVKVGNFRRGWKPKIKVSDLIFGELYDVVKENEYIEYTLGDERKVKIIFTGDGNETQVTETFEAENTNSLEMQKSGWQAILDNFKKYTESH